MTIRVPQLSKTLACEKGENLFKTLRQNNVPVASSCLGDGICGKCVVIVASGRENLSPPTDLEKALVDKYAYTGNQRVSCQCQVNGDVEVRTTYW